MTSNGSERLDRIEANLELVTQTLVRVAGVVESNRSDIDTILERLDQLSISMATFREQAEADRSAFQAEIRRIWEYLLSQHPNGSS